MTYTAKQQKGIALTVDSKTREILHDGGSRSGKTWALARYYILKSAKYPNTRRLVCRKSKSSCVASVWDQTIMPLLNSEFKGIGQEVGRGSSSHRVQFVNGSSIWGGGFDNPQHMDAILGQEWADIWLNEATDASYEEFGRLKTRLNWDPKLSAVPLKFLLDCNPRNPGHWLHRRYIEGVDPTTREPLPEDEWQGIQRIWYHPLDNAANLSPRYLESLQRLSGMNRKRFWEGIWCDNFNGQVFRFDRAINAVEQPIAYNANLETWCSWDFGISPSETFIIWYQIVPSTDKSNPYGCTINIIDELVDHDKSAAHYLELVNARPYKRDMFDACDPAGNIRDAKLETWVSLMRQAGRHVRYVTNFRPHEMIDNANAVMPYIRVCERQCPRTVECLENWSYPTDKDGKIQPGALPNHDEYSHGGTSFYYFTTNRFNPKKAIVT